MLNLANVSHTYPNGTRAGIDPYSYYIDRSSGDNVLRLADPG
jgi:hypothetical protein